MVLSGYLLFWPVPLDPGKFEAPEPLALSEEFQVNHLLLSAEAVGRMSGNSLESVAFDANGTMYVSVSDGRIIRKKNGTAERFENFVNTGGHPLGLAFDNSGYLFIADADLGLLRVSQDGTVEKLLSEIGGRPIVFADDVTISPDNIVYFSDASIYPITDNAKKEVLDSRPYGRLISYNPKTREKKILLKELYFANGVALDPDARFILVSETFAYRISRYWLKGPKRGERDFFIENLPGLPDNISCNGKDTFWVALVSPRNKSLDSLQANPFLRKVIMRLPQSWIPPQAPPKHGFVLGIDMIGKVKHNLQDPNGSVVSQITSALEYEGGFTWVV